MDTEETHSNDVTADSQEINLDDPKSTKQTIICELCCKTFSSSNTLKAHVKVVHESNKEQLICTFCSKSVKNLKTHIQNFHNNKRNPYICKYCPESFSMQKLLMQHISKEHPFFKCELCDKTIEQSAYKNHIDTVHKNKYKVNSPCQICPKILASAGSLKRHIEQVHEKEIFFCDTCDKAFTHKHTLQTHKKNIHEESKKLKCEKCNKEFESMSNCHGMQKQTTILTRKKMFAICVIEYFQQNYLLKNTWKWFTKETKNIHVINVKRLSKLKRI